MAQHWCDGDGDGDVQVVWCNFLKELNFFFIFLFEGAKLYVFVFTKFVFCFKLNTEL